MQRITAKNFARFRDRPIEYPETQKSIRPDVDARSVRLDVYVKDDKNTVYDIEMQVTDTKELPKRSRYYQSMIDLQLIDKGQSYKKLNQSYIYLSVRSICMEREGISIHLRMCARKIPVYA